MSQLKYWNGSAWVTAVVGAAGATGPQGPSGTLTVGTVTSTGPAGSPSITNVGTSQSATLNFVLQQGPTGPPAWPVYTFNTTTTAGTQAAGGFAYNNATLASVTAIYIDLADAGAVSRTAWYTAWSSPSSTIKGYLTIKNSNTLTSDSTVFAITSVTNNTTYYTIGVTYISGSATVPLNATSHMIDFARTGDTGGATGATGATGPTGAAGSSGRINASTDWTIYNDFHILPNEFWTVATSGTGATVATSTTAVATNRVGMVTINLGTTATGRGSMFTPNATMITLGGGVATFESSIYLPVLSSSLQRYQLLVGLFDTTTAANQTDGVYFLYDEGGVSTGSTAAAYWQTVTSAASARTFNTGLTQITLAATTWYTLKIVVNAAGTQADFYINGTLVGSTTTNIPTGIVNTTGLGVFMIKSVGTTTASVIFDYINYGQTFTTAR